MNTRALIRMNRQLCIRQQKSNPYIAAMKHPTAKRARTASSRIPLAAVWNNDAGGVSGGRSTWLWMQAAALALSVTIGFAIVAAQRLQYRRAENRLADVIRNQETILHQSERVNAALAAQIKTILARPMPPNHGEIQPANFVRQAATNQPPDGRL